MKRAWGHEMGRVHGSFCERCSRLVFRLGEVGSNTCCDLSLGEDDLERVLQHGPPMFHNKGPEHVPQHWPRARFSTMAPHMSHHRGTQHLLSHVPWTRPLQWSPNTSHILSPEHVPATACCYILFLHVFGIRMYESRKNLEGNCFSVYLF